MEKKKIDQTPVRQHYNTISPLDPKIIADISILNSRVNTLSSAVTSLEHYLGKISGATAVYNTNTSKASSYNVDFGYGDVSIYHQNQNGTTYYHIVNPETIYLKYPYGGFINLTLSYLAEGSSDKLIFNNASSAKIGELQTLTLSNARAKTSSTADTSFFLNFGINYTSTGSSSGITAVYKKVKTPTGNWIDYQ